MRFGIAFVLVSVLLAASLAPAQDARDSTTSKYEALTHSILVLKFGRSPEGQQIPSPDCFTRAPWDRRSWFGGMDPCTQAELHAPGFCEEATTTNRRIPFFTSRRPTNLANMESS